MVGISGSVQDELVRVEPAAGVDRAELEIAGQRQVSLTVIRPGAFATIITAVE